MNIDAGRFDEEKKKKEKSEKQRKKEIQRIIESQKKKKEVQSHIDADNQLSALKDLLESTKLDSHTKEIIEKVMQWENISEEEIQEIFEKIDEIENMDDVDRYLPKDFRLTKEEYSGALQNKEQRKKALQKIDDSLGILAKQIDSSSISWLNLFSGFLTLLDKNLILIQEHTIDIKESLEKKDGKIEEKTLLEKILQFLKEIFK